MATATQTITIDTASSPWVYSNGQVTTINGTSQTMIMAVNDLTDDVQLYPSTTVFTLTLDDGCKLHISNSPSMSRSTDISNGAATINGWSWFVAVDGGPEEEVKVTTMQCADADGNNTDLTLTFEYPGKPWQWTWARV